MTAIDHPDFHALVRQIRYLDKSGLDSTVARLVAADWLEEHNDTDWAELIRLQCGEEGGIHIGREGELILIVSHRLLHGDDKSHGLDSAHWSNGFINRIESTCEWWLKNGVFVVLRNPSVRPYMTDWPAMRIRTNENKINLYQNPYQPFMPHFIGGRVVGSSSMYESREKAKLALDAAALAWAESMIS